MSMRSRIVLAVLALSIAGCELLTETLIDSFGQVEGVRGRPSPTPAGE